MEFSDKNMNAFCTALEKAGMPLACEFADQELGYHGPCSLIPREKLEVAQGVLNAAGVPHAVVVHYTTSKSLLIVRTPFVDRALRDRATKAEQADHARTMMTTLRRRNARG